MNEFEVLLKSFADDLMSIEASVAINNQVVAYSNIQYEGDSFNWLSSHANKQQLTENIAQLQQTQLEVGSTARTAVLTLTYTLIQSLII